MNPDFFIETHDIVRKTLTEHWKFHLGDLVEAWQKTYDESLFHTIAVPHDWSVLQPFSQENSSGTGYVSGGIGWYRCTFQLPESYKEKKIILQFDGIYKHSQIWINNHFKGFHANGYTPFSFDVTNELVFGDSSPNVLCIRVDHTDISDSRWYTGSGLIRKVTLLIEEPICLSEHGVFFQVENADTEIANLSVTNQVCNNTNQKQTISVLNCIYDMEENCVASAAEEVIVNAAANITVPTIFSFEHPHLWSPKTPYLYQLKTFFILQGNDEKSYLVDSTPVGIRTFSFHSDMGFFLNGINTKLKGVCLHDDCGCLGSAVTKEVWYRRLYQLKKMGCNAIRMSHNPHMEELYDLCDEMGFIVMDEAFDEWEAPKNKWSAGHNVYPPKHEGYYLDFWDSYKSDLTSMVLRGRNHPSVILWSIGNEIDYPNDPYCHPLFQTMTGNNDSNKPEAEQKYNPDHPNAERLSTLAAMLADVIREIDTTRPITLAAAFPELSSKIGFLDVIDVAGYNYKEHLYEESHSRFPDLPFLGSENSHSLEAWKAARDNSYISGQFLWTGIDYLGEAHGWPYRASDAGLLTLAGFRKSSYYRRMSFWSDLPMAHLVCYRNSSSILDASVQIESWNYNLEESIRVCCYTNLMEAELFLNQKSLGIQTKSDDQDSIEWVVPFEPGRLLVKAAGHFVEPIPSNAESNGAEYHVENALHTVYVPSQIEMKEFAIPKEFQTEKYPIKQVEFSILDHLNHLVTAGAYPITVSVQNGTLIGLENGNIADCTEYTSYTRNSYHGHLIAYIRKADLTKPTKIIALSESLHSAEIMLQ